MGELIFRVALLVLQLALAAATMAAESKGTK